MAKSRPLSAKISSCIGFPEDTLGSVSLVSVYGRDKVTVEECEAVTECSQCIVSAKVCDGVVRISGQELMPVDFRLKTLSVRGKIKQIVVEQSEKDGGQ